MVGARTVRKQVIRLLAVDDEVVRWIAGQETVEGALLQVVRPESLDVERRRPYRSVSLRNLERVDLREHLAHQPERERGGLLDGGACRHRQAPPRTEAGQVTLEGCLGFRAECLHAVHEREAGLAAPWDGGVLGGEIQRAELTEVGDHQLVGG